MSVTAILSTFSLDLETVPMVEKLSEAWGIGKSELVRILIRKAYEVEFGQREEEQSQPEKA